MQGRGRRAPTFLFGVYPVRTFVSLRALANDVFYNSKNELL